MENRINQSILNHQKRNDCSKSLLCTYHDLIRIDEINAFKIVECFGVRIDDLCHIGGTVISHVYDGNKEQNDSKKTCLKIFITYLFNLNPKWFPNLRYTINLP